MSTHGTSSRTSRRAFLKVAAGTLTALTAAACGATPTPTPVPQPTAKPAAATAVPAPKNKVNVLYWRSLAGLNGEELDAMVKDFNASQGAVNVQVEFQGEYQPLSDKFTAAVAAKAMPDMSMFSDVHWEPFGRNGLLLALDELIKGPNGVDLNDYYPLVSRGVTGGKYYQLPLGVSTPIFHYSEETLKQAGLDGPPKTWNDLLDVYIPKTTAKDGSKTKVFGFSYSPTGFWWQQSFIWANGAQLSDESYNVYLNSPQMVDFCTRFQKLTKAGQVYVPGTGDDSLTYYSSGQTGLMVNSTGIIGRIDALAEKRFTPKVAFLPEGPAGRKVPTGGCGLSIIAGLSAEKRDACWQFLKWHQQPKQIARFDKVSGYIPFTKAAATELAPVFKDDPRKQAAADQLAWSRGQSEVLRVTRSLVQIVERSAALIVGNDDPKTVLDKLQKDVEAIMKEEGLRK